MPSHCSASAPTAMDVQVRPRPSLGDQHAEVLGRTGDALGGVVGTPRPSPSRRAHAAPRGTAPPAGVSPLMENAKSRVRTPMCAIERSRAVAGRFTPSVSATSSPCAQVSISRAVAIDAALIGGPNHGSLRPSATVSSSSCSRSRVSRQSASRRSGGQRGQLLGAGVDETRRILGGLGEHRREAGFVGDRDQRDPIGPQQVRDLVGDRPSRGGRGGRPSDRQAGRRPARRGRRSRRADRRPSAPLSPCRPPYPGGWRATADRGVRRQAEQVDRRRPRTPARVRAVGGNHRCRHRDRDDERHPEQRVLHGEYVPAQRVVDVDLHRGVGAQLDHLAGRAEQEPAQRSSPAAAGPRRTVG